MEVFVRVLLLSKLWKPILLAKYSKNDFFKKNIYSKERNEKEEIITKVSNIYIYIWA